MRVFMGFVRAPRTVLVAGCGGGLTRQDVANLAWNLRVYPRETLSYLAGRQANLPPTHDPEPA